MKTVIPTTKTPVNKSFKKFLNSRHHRCSSEDFRGLRLWAILRAPRRDAPNEP
jgi:hypothetical protein